jgi:hypothetical protein
MEEVREIVKMNHRGMPNSIKTRLANIYKKTFKTASTWSCGRADDIALQRYNLPEVFSSRPSEARSSLGRPTRSASMREEVRNLQYQNCYYGVFYNVIVLLQTGTRHDASLMRTSSRTIMQPSHPSSSRQPQNVSLIILLHQYLLYYLGANR